MPFFLLRHGSVDYDAYQDRFRGHGIDLLPLTERGLGEVLAAVPALRSLGIDLILSSPMTRALQTAMVLSWHLDREVKVELDLHEWVPDRTQQWCGGEVPTAAYRELAALGGEWPPGEERAWEPHSVVRRRVSAVLDRYTSNGTVLVVCHAGVIEAMTGVHDAAPCALVPLD